MTFITKKTDNESIKNTSKTLIYALHGFGKTTQCRNYQEKFGRGLILSGEGGLSSISDTGIDYLPFSSWDGKHEPDNGIYSFRGICMMMANPDSGFASEKFAWIAIDSLTELSDLLMRELERKYANDANGFKLWGDFKRQMIGSLKFIRDLPYHVLVTCLAKDEEDDNGRVSFWPDVHGKAVSKQLPALFDHVFAGHRYTETVEDGSVVVHRRLYADEVYGYHGKVRDPLRRIPPVINTSNVADVVSAIHMSSSDFKTWLTAVGVQAK